MELQASHLLSLFSLVLPAIAFACPRIYLNFEGKYTERDDLLVSVASAINAQRLRDNLEFLTKEPHHAGGSRDMELANWIRDQFESFGLDRVYTDSYDMLLTYPDESKPNHIKAFDREGALRHQTKVREDLLDGDERDSSMLDAFLAYSRPGKVSFSPGDLVYLNYAREKDLKDAASALGMKKGLSIRELQQRSFLNGKVAIARFGKGFRGNKVELCQKMGAKAVILFSDPADVAPEGLDSNDLYPHTLFLPKSGMQRGNIKTKISGDMLSPGWPSVEGAYRLTLEDIADSLLKVPAQPLGYEDAAVLLRMMGGPAPPSGSWVGGIPNVTYSIGGSGEAAQGYKDWRLEMEVNNYFEDAKGTNVLGVIRGAVEPDRYVFLMNHRDSWTYGGSDPSSATTQLIEAARVLGEHLKKGWRPRRSIVFASWAAEEYGLIGVAEWTQDKMNKLRDRAVAGINVDACVSGGPFYYPSSSPSLFDLPVQVTTEFPDPSNTSRSYYEYWAENWARSPSGPKTRLISAGSDHAEFIFNYGVPVIKLGFTVDALAHPGVSTNPVYHTAYDNFRVMDEVVDPGFHYHKLCTQFTTRLTLMLTEPPILPFNHLHLVKVMRQTFDKYRADGQFNLMVAHGVQLVKLEKAVDDLQEAIEDFNSRLNLARKSHQDQPLLTRAINDQLMMLERIFIRDQGLPGRSDARHMIYSPSQSNRYESAAFPGITDYLHDIQELEGLNSVPREGSDLGPGADEVLWRDLGKHVSDLMIIVRQAASFLKPVDLV